MAVFYAAAGRAVQRRGAGVCFFAKGAYMRRL